MANWIINNKDLLTVLVGCISLFVSVAAFYKANKIAAMNTKLLKSKTLSEIHEKIAPGRRLMDNIFKLWANMFDKHIESLSIDDEKAFMNFYNENYHNSLEVSNKDQSNRIHDYLHELSYTWERIENNEFTIEEIYKKRGFGVIFDCKLIRLYLLAHWFNHNEMKKKPDDRFWCYVPKIVNQIIEFENKKSPDHLLMKVDFSD